MSHGIGLQGHDGHEGFHDFFQRSLGIIGNSLVLQSGRFCQSTLTPYQAYCYVSPPAAGRQSMRARLAAGDDFGIRPIPVELPSYAGVQDGPGTFELAEDRASCERLGLGPGFLLRERVPDRNACLCQRSCLKPTVEGQACRKSLCNVQTWSMLQATCGAFCGGNRA